MLTATKNTYMSCARQLAKPYESYSINELADAYCDALDTNNSTLEDIYFSALILRFWYQIPKLHYDLQTFKVDYVQCYDGVKDAIMQACAPDNRKWQNTNISAEQVINQIIGTRFAAAVRYEANLQKNAGRHLEVSLDAPICGDNDDAAKTVGDTLESEDFCEDYSINDMTLLIQSYIDNNKVIEAIIIDNMIYHDVLKHYKKIVKTTNSAGETIKYTEYSSEFWPYKLRQIVSELPATYKKSFMDRYSISEEKLTTVLDHISELAAKKKTQKLYKYIDDTRNDLRASYSY